MASSIKYYTVVINNSISNASPSDGFIDNQKIEQYYAAAASSGTPNPLETTPSGLTYALCQAKRRGNVRYHEIIRQIELVSNIGIDPNFITATGGTALLAPTAFNFQIMAQFGDGAFVTNDELTPGATLTGMACIARCIARALTVTLYKAIDIFDPTSTQSVPATTTSVPRFGTRILVANSQGINAFTPSFTIGPYATSLAAATATITVNSLY